MRLRVSTRLLTAASAVMVVAASTPALAQPTTDVAVALSAPSASKKLSLGTARTYTISVTNAGASGSAYVDSFTVDATFTAPAPYTTIHVVPSGCKPTTPGTSPPPFPCTVTLASPLLTGASVTVSMAVTVEPPNPLPTGAADCPSGTVGDHDVTANISVGNLTQIQMIGSPPVATPVAVTDTNSANDAIPVTKNAISPWTDLNITSFTAPGNASEGQDLLYSATIHNSGPCSATGAFSDFFNPATIAYVTSTGCDNASDFLTDFGPPTGVLQGCNMASAAIPVGGDRSYTTTWKVLTFPKSVIAAALPVNIDVFWDWDVVNGPDPTSPANASAAAVSTTVDLSKNDSGCSTGGAGTLLALLPLLALRFVRRRAS